MFCPKCGYKNDDAAFACKGCGVALQEPRAQTEKKESAQGNQAANGHKVLIILGIVLIALMVLAIVIFLLGALVFFALGEGKYFVGYVMLNGYFPVINTLFGLDYLMMALGSIGIPILTAGLIWKAIAKKQ
jgi:hypothetical protein